MKSRKISVSALMIALVICALPAVSANVPKTFKAHKKMSPFLVRGPQAVSVAAGANYGLFTCQLGLTPGVVCYDPYQIRHAYNVDTLINAGVTGKGRTVVIVDAFQSPNIVNALNQFNSFYGLASLNGLGGTSDPSLGTFTQIAPDGLTPFDQNDDNQVGWAQEITLDVLWAHAIAPGANIVLVLAKSNNDDDILSATQYAVDHNLGDVISQSFGENESCVDPTLLVAEHKLFVKATLKHITLIASAGDDGAAQGTCDGNSWVKAASSPASDPLVMGVGGTELHAADYCLTSLGCNPTANPAAGTYEDEIVWNEGATGFGATGGGFSVEYRTPLYQLLSVPHSIKGKQRGVPDVGYNAAVLHGVLTYLDVPGIPAGFYLFGGTSAGSPQWAGIIALANQKAGRKLGFVNAALYLFSFLPPTYAAVFHDVTSGNNSVELADADGNPVDITGFNATKGWDATTGLGTPKADAVVSFLTRFTLPDDGDRACSGSDPSGPGHSGRSHVRAH
jgi:subtilase family serine protease